MHQSSLELLKTALFCRVNIPLVKLAQLFAALELQNSSRKRLQQHHPAQADRQTTESARTQSERGTAKSSLPHQQPPTTPPTTLTPFSFSSLIPILHRPAASTARQISSQFSCANPTWTASSSSSFTPRFCLALTTVRTYAKSKKMPPKKAVKEEKILLGRPGNSLKSGIVSRAVRAGCCHVLTLTVAARLGLRTWANRRCSRQSQNAVWVTRP